MHYDAQIQMIVSTFKISQTLDLNPETQKAAVCFTAKCQGGAKAQGFSETQAIVSIRESEGSNLNALGEVECRNNTFYIFTEAPRSFIDDLIKLFPYCQPLQGGYLTFDFKIGIETYHENDDQVLRVLSAEYKMVKQLSDNPDLISRP